MSLENKLTKGTLFASTVIVLVGATLIGNCFEYLYNKLDSQVNKESSGYRETLNNTNNSLIYTNR